MRASQLVICPDVDNGLIEKLELAIHDRLAKIQFEGAARLHAGVHCELEKALGTFAIGLGAVKRQVRVLHEDIRLAAVARRDCDTNTAPTTT